MAAVSTAIRCIHDPAYWILWDGRSNDYREQGAAAFASPAVMKVTRDRFRPLLNHHPNMRFIRWNTGIHSPLIDKQHELIVPRMRSIFVAIKWLVRQGFDELIFAGCDLRMTEQSTYAHGAAVDRHDMLEHNESMRREGEHLERWTVEAALAGVKFLSWSPGSVINDFMRPYEPGAVHAGHPRTSVA